MIYYINDKKKGYYLEATAGVIVSDCRWHGWKVVDLLMTCMVFGYEFEKIKKRIDDAVRH